MAKQTKILVFLFLAIVIICGCVFFWGINLSFNFSFSYDPNKKDISLNDTENMPKHIAVIMDGNRRWAKKHKLKPWIGHKQGVEPLKATVEFCLEHKIPYLSVYAFSLENFKRSPEELSYLFDILAKEFATDEFIGKLVKNGVCVKFIGDQTKFPEKLRPLVETTEQKTAHNNRLHLNILFCYGGRQEIIAATKSIAYAVAKHTVSPAEVTEQLFERYLWTQNTPDPDLVIRTGFTRRLSNFLPYQSTYSELAFVDCYWPDMTKEHLAQAVKNYIETKRNFGS